MLRGGAGGAEELELGDRLLQTSLRVHVVVVVVVRVHSRRRRPPKSSSPKRRLRQARNRRSLFNVVPVPTYSMYSSLFFAGLQLPSSLAHAGMNEVWFVGALCLVALIMLGMIGVHMQMVALPARARQLRSEAAKHRIEKLC